MLYGPGAEVGLSTWPWSTYVANFHQTDVDTSLFAHIFEMVQVVLVFYMFDFQNSMFIRAFRTQTVTSYVIYISMQ